LEQFEDLLDGIDRGLWDVGAVGPDASVRRVGEA
jgi:hypothetical protein